MPTPSIIEAPAAAPPPAPPVSSSGVAPAALSPEKTVGPPTGSLAPEHVQKVVRGSLDNLRSCYEQALLRDPNATGSITVRLMIDRNGDVFDARPSLKGNLPIEMNACVERVIRGLKFDAPSGGIVTVVYPIVFTPEW